MAEDFQQQCLQTTRAAVAMDLRGVHAVAVDHGEAVGGDEAHLLADVLPALARAHGAADTTLAESSLTTFVFEGPYVRR